MNSMPPVPASSMAGGNMQPDSMRPPGIGKCNMPLVTQSASIRRTWQLVRTGTQHMRLPCTRNIIQLLILQGRMQDISSLAIRSRMLETNSIAIQRPRTQHISYLPTQHVHMTSMLLTPILQRRTSRTLRRHRSILDTAQRTTC
jgi:hypothetical protein